MQSGYFELRARIARQLLLGAEGSRTEAWSVDRPWCDDPKEVHEFKKGGVQASTGQQLPSLVLHTLRPCRKCEKCLKLRKLQWRDRAMVETAKAPRTWAVVLTLTDRYIALALAAAKSRGGPLEPQLYKGLQKYFKRMRKQGLKFRYLAVHELGEETGRSHYHLLVHEIHGQPEVKKRDIERHWPAHVHARLVGSGADDLFKAASYITSYTTKAFDTRPRPSIRYGAKESTSANKSVTLLQGRSPRIAMRGARGVKK